MLNPCEERTMTKTNEEHYLALIAGLDAVLRRMQQVIREHEECPGCDLCRDCDGMSYTMRGYLDLLESDAPARLVTEFRREHPKDDLPPDDDSDMP